MLSQKKGWDLHRWWSDWGPSFSCLLFVTMLLVNSWVMKFMAWIPFDFSQLLHLSPEYARHISRFYWNIFTFYSVWLNIFLFMYLYIFVWLCLTSLALNYKFLSLLVGMHLQQPVPTIHYPSKLIVEPGYRRNFGLDHKCQGTQLSSHSRITPDQTKPLKLIPEENQTWGAAEG